MSRNKVRYVIDTNVIISSAFFGGPPGQIFDEALLNDIFIFTNETLEELREVLFRSKFDDYMSRSKRVSLLEEVLSASIIVETVTIQTKSKDHKDDKFLAAAVSGNANYLITGDRDLLILQMVDGIPIISPRQGIERIA